MDKAAQCLPIAVDYLFISEDQKSFFISGGQNYRQLSSGGCPSLIYSFSQDHGQRNRKPSIHGG